MNRRMQCVARNWKRAPGWKYSFADTSILAHQDLSQTLDLQESKIIFVLF